MCVCEREKAPRYRACRYSESVGAESVGEGVSAMSVCERVSQREFSLSKAPRYRVCGYSECVGAERA